MLTSLKLSLKRIALASFPRSGNTWLRFMIEEATGMRSGSVYKDRIMRRDNDGVVIKTHGLDSVSYTSAIHLLRNPFDVIESFFYWKKNVAGDEKVCWDKHAEEAIFAWKTHTEHWLQAKYPVFRVRYEDLHTDIANKLNLLLLWLGYNVSPEKLIKVIEKAHFDKMQALNPELGDKFFRRGRVGMGQYQFTNEQKLFVIDTLYDLLVLLGYKDVMEV